MPNIKYVSTYYNTTTSTIDDDFIHYRYIIRDEHGKWSYGPPISSKPKKKTTTPYELRKL